MIKQKRGQKRYVKRFNVEFTDGKVSFPGISSDFSIEGFFVRTTHPMPVDSILDFRIHVSEDNIVKVRGHVVRSAKPLAKWYAGKKLKLSSRKEGMGVKVIEMDKGYLDLIRSILPVVSASSSESSF